MTLRLNFATDCRSMPRMTALRRHHRHCLIITIILFVGYYTVYKSYNNYFVRYHPFFRLVSATTRYHPW
jgi:hypothetical protein